MIHLLRNKTFYLGTSFVLLLVSLPLISVGAMSAAEAGAGAGGTSTLLWVGIACGSFGTLVLPLQRLITGTDRSRDDEDD